MDEFIGSSWTSWFWSAPPGAMRLASLVLNVLSVAHVLASNELRNYSSTILPITHLFNNQAASVNGSTANFDGLGSSYNANYLPGGLWDYDEITYVLPASWGYEDDNMIARGQTIGLPHSETIQELHMLYALDGDSTDVAETFDLYFADGSSQKVQLSAQSWWTWPDVSVGALTAPYHFVNQSTIRNYNASMIYQWSTSVSTVSPLRSVTLPDTSAADEKLHVFAISYSPSTDPGTINGSGLPLSIRRVRFTTRWEDINETRAQAVEVTLANEASMSSFSQNTTITSPYSIEISGSGVETISAGAIYRLMPSDQIRVDVLVSSGNVKGNATITVRDGQGDIVGTSNGWPVTPLPQTWTSDSELLATHETPTWYNQAKYGIFIHWGIYSVPAWAPSNSYAEWYNWALHSQPLNASNPTWQYHLQTFGNKVLYDDFIANLTASSFNASAWLDLIDNAGAKYFVIVTKHHDGFALFDSGNTTHRSSVYLGPERDFVGELFEAARSEKPQLHRGTYYSLPEWFSPDSAKYGFGDWPGGLAHDPFNHSYLEPYTGRLNISDYLEDLQLPQMMTLAETYDTEIMWCDIGGPNRTLDFAAAFYNHAMSQGRQVTMNNRCGAVPDFDTPEYAELATIQSRKWEATEGLDPFSFGLNNNTEPGQYKNATTIIQTLVDIVSKNGNFLLDIGPTAEGIIIEPMAKNLLAAGEWLRAAGDCVYATEYWFKGAQPSLDSSLRFLTTPKTFCVVSFVRPKDRLVVDATLPIFEGDNVTYLSGPESRVSVPWSLDGDSRALTLDLSRVDLSSPPGGAEAWAFEIAYAG